MKKKFIIIPLVIVCVAALAIAVIISTRNRNSVPENPDNLFGNTSGNLYNGGMFCESDGYVYFSNPYDNNALYRMLPDETQAERIVASETSSLNADGKFLYFYQSGSGSGAGFGYVVSSTGVYRVQKDNPKNIKCLDKIVGGHVVLAGNSVFYTCAGDTVALSRIDITGENKEIVLEKDILPASIDGSYFYYSNNDGTNLHVMAMNRNTGSSRKALAEDIYMPVVEGETLYGIDVHNNYALVRINLADGSKTTLDAERTDLLNVTGSYIYYQTSGPTPQLRRIGKDGSNMEVVADGAYNTINATSRYVYFTRFSNTLPIYKTPVSGPVNVTTFEAASAAAIEALQ
ncbi:MAG: DUF5050 domain-containing protein [Roseburia sp.]|nr:DUF5050 domain-containing protein [Roseburia sp.]